LTFRLSGSSNLVAQTTASNEQQFYIDPIDFPYYKISPLRKRSYAFDLSGANSVAGTSVCIYQYTADTDTPTHRQWMLCPLTSQGTETGIEQIEVTALTRPSISSDGVFDLTGRCLVSGPVTDFIMRQLPHGIYVVSSKGERRLIRVSQR
jgi:hypothetical protein